MNADIWAVITFGLLGLAICAAWFVPPHSEKNLRLSPWMVFLICAAISGLAGGHLTWVAFAELTTFAVIAYLAGRSDASRMQKILFGSLTAIFALALAMHRLPGFNNPILLKQIKFSVDAAPFTLYANFDKAAAGLILVAFLCAISRSLSEWKEVLRRTYPVVLVTAICVMIIAVAIGYVKPDPKISLLTALFLITNLLFTCVAEEAFFRGFLQERMSRWLCRIRYGEAIVILCSGTLFGLAHFSGGLRYVMLATIAGIGYAYAYAKVRRIEAPIITHFVLNAVHFIGFTYPYMQ